ncbi:MAG: hypothetical protein K2L98_04420 [Bacilli bacterium]|nr:hypothetical protein [Bacilli bacterium]
MIPIDERRLKQILKNNTILTPEQIFTNLCVDDKDFITFNELCDISRKETLKKLYALRDMCNLDFANYDLVEGIAYEEKTRPILTLLFQPCAASRFKLAETVKVPREELAEHEEEKKKKEKNAVKSEDNKEENEESKDTSKKKSNNNLPAYSIDQDMLDYLLTTKVLRSKLDQFLIEKHRPLLELYKAYLDSGVFCPDFQTCDCTGNFTITSKHEDYLSLGEIDSIIIPEKFGEVNMHYSGWDTYDVTYNPGTEKMQNANGNNVNSDFGERVFIHKALLPKNFNVSKK